MENYGLIPSPVDVRDILTSEIAPEIKRYPEELLPPFDLTVLDQNGYPACVGFSCAAIKQYQEFKERISKIFDGLWIYNECKKIDGIPEIDGTFFRSGMKVLHDTGAKTLDSTDPDPYKIGAYAQVTDMSFEGLKKMIFVYGAVLAGYRGSNGGWSQANVRPPLSGEKIWGHAVTLVGYTKDKLIIHNSWGKNKGDKGIFYSPENYLPFEAWVVNCDVPTCKESVTGWVAKKYISNGKTIANLKLREEPSLSGKLIKVLPCGTTITIVDGLEINADGYVWIKIKINN